jgi:hypothetical protein
MHWFRQAIAASVSLEGLHASFVQNNRIVNFNDGIRVQEDSEPLYLEMYLQEINGTYMSVMASH